MAERDVLYEQLLQIYEQIYDLYRTALMNRMYYGVRLATYMKWNTGLESTLALGMSGAIGAWAIWRTSFGQYVWAAIAGVATLIAVLKPILQLPKAIERTSKLWVGHTDLYLDLQHIVSTIKVVGDVTKEMENSFHQAKERYRKLALDDDPQPKKRLQKECYDAVNQEIPPASLWVPPRSPQS